MKRRYTLFTETYVPIILALILAFFSPAVGMDSIGTVTPTDASLLGKSVPAGSGKVVPAGLGKGHWRTYDVTGKAMNAAIPVVMFDGILDRQMELGGNLEQIFSDLNRSLYRKLDSRTFVCFTMGELDLSTRILRLSNSGCPYPYHFRAETGTVVELQVDAYPLGVRPDTQFDVVETQLESGDYVIFCSDGIVEAENGEGELFGYERMVETIREACVEEVSAEATIDRLLSVVSAFKGDAPQSDDMTCVVLRVKDALEG